MNDREEYLEFELERERDTNRQYREAETRKAKEQREERERQREESMYWAEDWEDAFSKCLRLVRQQIADEDKFMEKYGDRPKVQSDPEDYFHRYEPVVVFAQQAYNEEMQGVEEQINKLRQQAREKAAQRLLDKYGENNELGQIDLAQSLRDDDPQYLVGW